MSNGNQLGEFLQARRARIRPSDVGLPTGAGLRRTPGLRREELATLAGVSIDYYIRLEQGREHNPGSGILDALAAAMHLNEEELAHLYALAARAASRAPRPPSAAGREVRPGILLLLETIRPNPAYVLSRYSDVLAINPEGLALYAGLDEWPAERRNTVRYFFTHPAARQLFPDWAPLAADTVANLHTLAAIDPEAPELVELVGELSRESRDFADMWQHHEIRERRGERKRFRHPLAGDLTLESEVLRFGGNGQRMTIYQAPVGTPDHDAMLALAPAAKPAGQDHHRRTS